MAPKRNAPIKLSIHCLRCGAPYEESNGNFTLASNHRIRVAGTCTKCNSKTSKFVSGDYINQLSPADQKTLETYNKNKVKK